MTQVGILDVMAAVTQTAQQPQGVPEGLFAASLEGAVSSAALEAGLAALFEMPGAAKGQLEGAVRAVALENLSAGSFPMDLTQAAKKLAAAIMTVAPEATDGKEGEEAPDVAILEAVAGLLAQVDAPQSQAQPAGQPKVVAAPEFAVQTGEVTRAFNGSPSFEAGTGEPVPEPQQAVEASSRPGPPEAAPVEAAPVKAAVSEMKVESAAPAEAEVKEAQAEPAQRQMPQPQKTEAPAAPQQSQQTSKEPVREAAGRPEAAVSRPAPERAAVEFEKIEVQPRMEARPANIEGGNATRATAEAGEPQPAQTADAKTAQPASQNAAAAAVQTAAAGEAAAQGEAPKAERIRLEASTEVRAATETDAPGTHATARTQDVPKQAQAAGADQERLIARISQAITQAEQQGRSTIRVRLYPPELGTVRVEVSSVRGTVTARIETSTEAAQNALNTNLAGLRAQIRESGVDLGEVLVQYRNAAAQFGAEHRQQQRGGYSVPQRRSRTRFEGVREAEPVRREAAAANAGLLNVLV